MEIYYNIRNIFLYSINKLPCLNARSDFFFIFLYPHYFPYMYVYAYKIEKNTKKCKNRNLNIYYYDNCFILNKYIFFSTIIQFSHLWKNKWK